MVLLAHGADIDRVALFGATALHWAAYCGTPSVVDALLDKGENAEARCSEFDCTPLFWAVQGYSKYGPDRKTDQLILAKRLIERGSSIHTRNIEGVSAIERSRESVTNQMTLLLQSLDS